MAAVHKSAISELRISSGDLFSGFGLSSGISPFIATKILRDDYVENVFTDTGQHAPWVHGTEFKGPEEAVIAFSHYCWQHVRTKVCPSGLYRQNLFIIMNLSITERKRVGRRDYIMDRTKLNLDEKGKACKNILILILHLMKTYSHFIYLYSLYFDDMQMW